MVTFIGLVGGAILLVPTLILLASLHWGRAALIKDYPSDIQELAPEFSPAEVRRGRILGPAFFVALLAAGILTTWLWLQGPDGGGLVDAYLVALGVMVLFAVIDLVIVDWLVICWWRPRWVIILGTENAHGWGDYMFHLREQVSLPGILALVGIPVVTGGIAFAIPH